VVVGGEGEDVGYGDGVGGPDNLAYAKVPPHVWIVEAGSDGQYRKDREQARNRYRKGEESFQEAVGETVCDQRGR
jgi:hypothetical protein